MSSLGSRAQPMVSRVRATSLPPVISLIRDDVLANNYHECIHVSGIQAALEWLCESSRFSRSFRSQPSHYNIPKYSAAGIIPVTPNSSDQSTHSIDFRNNESNFFRHLSTFFAVLCRCWHLISAISWLLLFILWQPKCPMKM